MSSNSGFLSNPGAILGVPLHVVNDHPKMTLYSEPLPGVAWPPGFKAEMDAWMLRFFGVTNLVKDGEVLNASGRIYMNPRTFAQYQAHIRSRP